MSDLPPLMEPYDDSGNKAANDLISEVERLRAALREIAGAPTSWMPADDPVRRIAKAALSGRSDSDGSGVGE